MATDKFDISALKKPKKTGVLKKKKAAPVRRKAKKKTGRPVKKSTELLSKKITVNLTEVEFNKLLELSGKRYNISLANLVRGLLKENKHI